MNAEPEERESSNMPTEYALELREVDKHFGGTSALRSASLLVRPGTVHALIGGNGSGKSTAIKILAGVYRADAGRLRVFGADHPLESYTSSTASSIGLRFVHQDLGLFEELSVEENFALSAGYPTNGTGRVRWGSLRRDVARVLKEFELEVDPRRPIRDLRPSDRTMIAIARALQKSEGARRILVLDEPTASLAAHESSLLLERVRRLAARGQTIIIVSHRMQEVLAVAEDFTVFRDGVVAGALTDAKPTEDELIAIMAGGAAVRLHATEPLGEAGGAPLLTVKGLASGPLRDIDFEVREGEVLGIAGLVGSGRSSLLHTLAGDRRPIAGMLMFAGKPYTPRHIAESMRQGVALVPENRVREAAFMDRSVRENLAVSMYREYWSTRWMPRGARGESRERAHCALRYQSGRPARALQLDVGG